MILFTLLQEGTGTLTCVADSGVTINSIGGGLSTTSQYESLVVEKISANLWTLTKSKTELPDVSILVSGKMTAAQYAALGFDMARDIAISTYTKELIYTGPDLTSINIWTDATKTVKMYTKVLNYTLGELTSVTTTRFVDSATFTKTLTYTLGNLTQVDGV